MSDLILHDKTLKPELLKGNISEYILKLIKKGIYNFAINYEESEEKLREHHNYLNQHITNINLPFQKHDLGFLCAYNKAHIPLSISGLKDFSGLVQLIDDKLIYFPGASSLNHWRDSYLFGYTEDKLYVCKKPIYLVGEFMHQGFKLYKSANPIYNLKNDNKPKNLEIIQLNSIDTSEFS